MIIKKSKNNEKTEGIGFVYIAKQLKTDKSLISLEKKCRISWSKDNIFLKNSKYNIKKDKRYASQSGLIFNNNIILNDFEPCETLEHILFKNR